MRRGLWARLEGPLEIQRLSVSGRKTKSIPNAAETKLKEKQKKDRETTSISPHESKKLTAVQLLLKAGPGLITGASDDDPSGIATYSQVGAQFGYGMLWTMVFSYPLMAGIQEISARIGRVTGRGIAGNIRLYYSKSVLY